jgi:DNA polymerase III epsilon subunit-like protein
MTKELFISVDIEASGTVPEKYSMLSIGAVVVGDDSKEFYRELKPINFNFEKEALAICRNSFSEDLLRHLNEMGNNKPSDVLYALQDFGHEPGDVMEDFYSWTKEVSKDYERPLFLGYNASFDWQFINSYFVKYIGENPFGYDPVDIKSYFMGRKGLKWSNVSKKAIKKELGMSENDLPHNALYDAKEQAQMFELMLENF